MEVEVLTHSRVEGLSHNYCPHSVLLSLQRICTVRLVINTCEVQSLISNYVIEQLLTVA